MQSNRTISINDAKFVHETVDGEVIIINLESGTYYGLRGSALEVWSFLQQGLSQDALTGAVATRYGVGAGEVGPAVEKFIAALGEEGIVTFTEQAGGTPSAGDSAPPSAPFTPPIFSKHTNMSDLLLLDPIHDVDEQGWPHERVG